MLWYPPAILLPSTQETRSFVCWFGSCVLDLGVSVLWFPPSSGSAAGSLTTDRFSSSMSTRSESALCSSLASLDALGIALNVSGTPFASNLLRSERTLAAGSLDNGMRRRGTCACGAMSIMPTWHQASRASVCPAQISSTMALQSMKDLLYESFPYVRCTMALLTSQASYQVAEVRYAGPVRPRALSARAH